MGKLSDKLKELKKAGKVALIPYVTAGFPSLPATERLISVLSESADVIEIGIPFSDPMADGPTIQKASQISLSQGVTLTSIFEMIAGTRDRISTPLVLMAYYNNIFKYGLGRFASDAFEAGVCGIIVPDLTVEESKPWLEAAKGKLETVFLVAPTSSAERIERVASASQGFVYCVSSTGVTGARASVSEELVEFIKRVRAKTQKPLAVGFGISGPDQAAQVAKFADGVIIGSALVDLLEKAASEQELVANARNFMTAMRQAIDKARRDSIKN